MEFVSNTQPLFMPKGECPYTGNERGRNNPNGVSCFIDEGGRTQRFVLQINGEIVACLQLMLYADRAPLLTNAFVKEQHQRQGIATRLLKAVKQKHPFIFYSTNQSEAGKSWVNKVK